MAMQTTFKKSSTGLPLAAHSNGTEGRAGWVWSDSINAIARIVRPEYA